MSDSNGFGLKLKLILGALCVVAVGAVLLMPTESATKTEEVRTATKPRVHKLPTVTDRCCAKVSGPRRITVASD